MNTRLTPPENHDKSLALELKPFRHIDNCYQLLGRRRCDITEQ